MMYVEIKKKYAHLFVLIIIVLGFLWLYTGIFCLLYHTAREFVSIKIALFQL